MDPRLRLAFVHPDTRLASDDACCTEPTRDVLARLAPDVTIQATAGERRGGTQGDTAGQGRRIECGPGVRADHVLHPLEPCGSSALTEALTAFDLRIRDTVYRVRLVVFVREPDLPDPSQAARESMHEVSVAAFRSHNDVRWADPQARVVLLADVGAPALESEGWQPSAGENLAVEQARRAGIAVHVLSRQQDTLALVHASAHVTVLDLTLRQGPPFASGESWGSTRWMTRGTISPRAWPSFSTHA